MSRPPRAFFSYSWTSEEHAEWIRQLADRLIHDGVDVILDQYDLKEGNDTSAFMERSVNDPTVTHVIALSDRRYAERADARDGGVGTETLILTPEVYAEAGQERVIPVVLEHLENGDAALPIFLRGRWYIDMSAPQGEQEGYEQLLRVLHGKPRHERPALGSPPDYITTSAPTRRTATRLRAFVDALQREKATTFSLAGDFLFEVRSELSTLKIEPALSDIELDEAVMAKLAATLPLRDEIIAFFAAVLKFSSDDRLSRTLGDALETVLQQLTAPIGSYYPRQFDHFQFLAHELLLYVVALASKHFRLDVIRSLTERAYLPPPRYIHDGRTQAVSYVAMRGYYETLERRCRSGDRDHLSTADLIRDRATNLAATFDELVGADLLLFLKDLLSTAHDDRWYPILMGHAKRAPSLLRRATQKSEFKLLMPLLGVTSGDDLRAKVGQELDGRRAKGWSMYSNTFIGLDQLLNLADLDTKD